MNSIDVNMTPCTSIQGVQESPFQTGNSRIFTSPTSVQDKENQTPCDASKWLRRNDNYIRPRQQVCGDIAMEPSAQMVQDPGETITGIL